MRTVISAGAAPLLASRPAGARRNSRNSRRRSNRRRRPQRRRRPPSHRRIFRDRHQLRPRRRHRLRQQGQPGRRPEAERLRGHRGRQAAEDRDLQAGQARRRHCCSIKTAAARRSAPTSTRRSEAARDDVRLFAIFLDDYHVRRGASLLGPQAADRASSRTQLGPSDMIGVMYPLQPIASVRMTRNHSAVMRGHRSSSRDASSTTSPGTRSRRRTRTIPTEIVEKIRNQVSLSAIKALIVHMGVAEGRAQGADSRQRGLHQHAAAADAERRSRRCPDRAIPPPAIRWPGRTIRTRSARRGSPALDMDSDLREVYDAANRNNVAIYAVDPRGLAGFEFDINEGIGLQTDRTVSELDDGHAAPAGRSDRRPRDRQPQRSRRSA